MEKELKDIKDAAELIVALKELEKKIRPNIAIRTLSIFRRFLRKI